MAETPELLAQLADEGWETTRPFDPYDEGLGTTHPLDPYELLEASDWESERLHSAISHAKTASGQARLRKAFELALDPHNNETPVVGAMRVRLWITVDDRRWVRYVRMRSIPRVGEEVIVDMLTLRVTDVSHSVDPHLQRVWIVDATLELTLEEALKEAQNYDGLGSHLVDFVPDPDREGWDDYLTAQDWEYVENAN